MCLMIIATPRIAWLETGSPSGAFPLFVNGALLAEQEGRHRCEERRAEEAAARTALDRRASPQVGGRVLADGDGVSAHPAHRGRQVPAAEAH